MKAQAIREIIGLALMAAGGSIGAYYLAEAVGLSHASFIVGSLIAILVGKRLASGPPAGTGSDTGTGTGSDTGTGPGVGPQGAGPWVDPEDPQALIPRLPSRDDRN